MLNTKETEFNVEINFYGRVGNVSLPANQKNSLIPLFEAVMNGIHAIEDKFGSSNLNKGKIIITTERNEEDSIIGFIVADNGIGLNDDNLSSFIKSDSLYKFNRGGKGVGRLSWLKALKDTRVESIHLEEQQVIRTEFDFRLTKQSQVQNFLQTVVKDSSSTTTGTIVKLFPFRPEYKNVCPNKIGTIANRLISHFLSYFLTTNVPTIILSDIHESINLDETTSSMQSEEAEFDLEIEHANGEKKQFKLDCFKIKRSFSDDETGNNAIYYIANGRVVRRINLDNALGLKTIGDDLVFCGTVTGEYCDQTANQERTSFNWSDDFFKDLHTACVDKSKIYLKSEIGEIRERQSEVISKVGKEHPRFFGYAKDPSTIVEDLSLGTQSEEDIFLEMSRRSLRTYKKRKNEYTKATKARIELDDKAKEFTALLQNEALSSLAECVYKRKLILELMDSKMEYLEGSDKKKALEEAVHEIICPLGVDSDDIAYNDHNLWIIDDSLAFYTYFGSDLSFKKVSGGQIDSPKEPDLVFFDESLGFDRSKSDQPITIIEFKRPERNDYSLSNNPITQVRKYVDEMRDKKAAINQKGRRIRTVD